MSKILEGVTVLVTRPVHQAEHLCQLIENAGGKAVRLPAIDIIPTKHHNLNNCHLSEFDIAIFISANAVHYALLTPCENHKTLPQNLQMMAVGEQTANMLKKNKIHALFPPAPFNSETLLAMPECQSIQDKKIIIFRGESGRELLADTLRQRGAQVNYIDVYKRVRPEPPEMPIESIDAITITSVESFNNLSHMLADQHWLKTTPFVVLSERIADYLQNLGIQAPIYIAPQANDEGLLTALFANEIKGNTRTY